MLERTCEEEKPVTIIKNIKRAEPLPKLNMKNIKLRPMMHKKVVSVQSSPRELSPSPTPHQVQTSPTSALKDISVPSLAGVEKSKKLRELIEAQERKMKNVPVESTAKNHNNEDKLVTVIEEKSEDENNNVACLNNKGTIGSLRDSAIAKKNTADTLGVSSRAFGTSRILNCRFDF